MNQIILLNTPIIQLFFPPFNCILLCVLRAIQSGSARRESKGRDGIKCTVLYMASDDGQLPLANPHPPTIQYGCAINQFISPIIVIVIAIICPTTPIKSLTTNCCPAEVLATIIIIIDMSIKMINHLHPNQHPLPTHLIGLNRACMSLG